MNESAPSSSILPRSLVIYLPDLSGGGTERLYLGLAPLFQAAGFRVTFLLDRKEGELLGNVPAGIDVIALNARRQIEALPRLIHFLRCNRVDLFLSAMEHMNIMAVLARILTRSSTRLVVTQHNNLSSQAARKALKFRVLPKLYQLIAARADALVAVSQGVADDMARCANIPGERINVIYNGAIRADFDMALREPLPPFWPEKGAVLLTVGRFVPQKDHATLLRAFARIPRQKAAWLVLLGEGPLRGEIEALARQLGIADRLLMPGFVQNPLPAMARADAVVLSSRFEGFGLVLAEALACGTSVVSTDCPHGPAEVLDHGRYGRLVPVGDPETLATAIVATLEEQSPDRAGNSMRGRLFSIERCAQNYLTLFNHLLQVRKRAADRQNAVLETPLPR